MQLFLASSSPRRISLLNDQCIPFTLIQNQLTIEPNPKDYGSPLEYVKQCSFLKADRSKLDYKGLIMGVDTIISFENRVYGKPIDKNDALSTLNHLNGQTHCVSTACCLINTLQNTTEFCIDTAEVRFKHVNNSVLKNYVSNYNILDKAGGYAIQDNPPFIEQVIGDMNTVIGLPVIKLLKFLQHYGIVY